MANLFRKLRNLTRFSTTPGRETAVSPGGNPPALNDAAVIKLMSLVDQTEEDQFNCEETFALLDEYVEIAASNENAATIMPLVERHIHGCPDCSARFEALLRILQSEQ